MRASESIATQWGRQRLTQSIQKSDTTGVMIKLSELRKHFSKMRELMRLMGTETGIEIEPLQQTLLADKTEKLSGVLCSCVPGAGGNDAIFAITLSSKARTRVEEMWSQWGVNGTGTGVDVKVDNNNNNNNNTVVCPLLLRAEGGLKSGVRAEFDIGWD